MDSIFFLLFLVLVLQPTGASNTFTMAGVPHDYAKDPMWDYANLSAWPKLCQVGKRQSPVSFAELAPHEVVYDKKLGPLQFSKGCSFAGNRTSLKIENEVNTISARLISLDDPYSEEPSPCTTRDPTNPESPLYHFVAMHFHLPVEHVFPRAKPVAEVHLVFSSENRSGKMRRMVIAVQLVESDKVNTTSVRALLHILVDGALPPKHAITTCTLTEELAIPGLLPRWRNYLAYDGSLTTPPCTEGLKFIVMTSPQIISALERNRLRQALNQANPENQHKNRRPTQPLNGRVVYRFVDRAHNRTRRSKGYTEDYYEASHLDWDAWGHEEYPVNKETSEQTNYSSSESGINDTLVQPSHNIVWPHPLTSKGSILFISAALVLLFVTILLYRQWCEVASSDVCEEEVEPLSQHPQGYGTVSV